MLALDTNILVYAHRREAAEHRLASELIRSFAEGAEPWAIPWACTYEFFSVVEHSHLEGRGEHEQTSVAPARSLVRCADPAPAWRD